MNKTYLSRKEDFQKTIRQDYNEFVDKLIKAKSASCKIHAVEKPDDDVGIVLCKSGVDKMRKEKTRANAYMDIWEVLSSP